VDRSLHPERLKRSPGTTRRSRGPTGPPSKRGRGLR
jgi:hypothetical protein